METGDGTSRDVQVQVLDSPEFVGAIRRSSKATNSYALDLQPPRTAEIDRSGWTSWRFRQLITLNEEYGSCVRLQSKTTM
jgi:hypothetical protein